MLAGNVEDAVRLEALERLRESVELFWFRQLREVARVENERWRCGQRIDLGNGLTKRRCHVRIRCLIEADMAIADLNEAEIPCEVPYLLLQHIAQGIRFQNAALQKTKSARAGPGHAFQKSATIDAVVVVILFNVLSHVLSSSCAPALAKRALALRSPV